MAERVLQQLKMRDPVLVECDEFAVDHGVACDAFERFRDFDVTVADDLAVAAIERDLAALDLGDHAKAVVFVLEDPSRIVEGRVRQRRKHRLKAFRQCRCAAHGCEAFALRERCGT